MLKEQLIANEVESAMPALAYDFSEQNTELLKGIASALYLPTSIRTKAIDILGSRRSSAPALLHTLREYDPNPGIRDRATCWTTQELFNFAINRFKCEFETPGVFERIPLKLKQPIKTHLLGVFNDKTAKTFYRAYLTKIQIANLDLQFQGKDGEDQPLYEEVKIDYKGTLFPARVSLSPPIARIRGPGIIVSEALYRLLENPYPNTLLRIQKSE